jgi:YD repeat-containing protein
VVTGYDQRGRKTQVTDTDLGTWNYVFDGFGDLVGQTDARNQQFAMTYDQLGRMLTKQNVTTLAQAQWIYDTGGGAAMGKLAAMIGEPDANLNGSCALPTGAVVTGGNRAVKTYAYNGLSDVQAVSECADGATFQTAYDYDAIGRQSVIRYPAVNSKRLAVGYHYTSVGYLHYLSDESAITAWLWQAKARDAFGKVTDEQAANRVENVQTRSPGERLADPVRRHRARRRQQGHPGLDLHVRRGRQPALARARRSGRGIQSHRRCSRTMRSTA